MNKEKIIFKIRGLGIGGIERLTIDILNNLKIEDKEIVLLLENRSENALENQLDKRIEKIYLLPKKFEEHFNKIKKMKNEQKNLYNKVYFGILLEIKRKLINYNLNRYIRENNVKVFIDYSGHSLSQIKHITKVIKVLWVHLSISTLKENKKKRYIDKLKKYDKIVVVCKELKNELLEIAPELSEKIEVIYNFIDREKIEERLENEIPLEDEKLREDNYCMMLGRLDEVKDYETAIKAFEILRNKGIEEATGEYFLFVDSDDWIEEYAIEYFIRNLTNEDVIGANFSIYDEEKSEKYEKKLNIEYEKIKFGEYFLNDGYEIVVWNKLYKKEFILKNNIKFIENIIHEDVNFIFKTYMKSPIVKYLEKSTYIYRTNRKDSIMYKVKRKKELSTASLNKIIYDLEELLEDNKIEKNFIKDRIRLKILSLKIGALKTEDKKLLANEKFNLDNLIFEISRNNYLEEEKEIIRKEFQAIILQREYTKFTISNLLLWKYKILNLNILRKILSRKLKKIMKGEV